METVEFDPDKECLIVIEEKNVILRGKSEQLLYAFAFFLMPKLDEELASHLKEYVENHREEILKYMKQRELKKA